MIEYISTFLVCITVMTIISLFVYLIITGVRRTLLDKRMDRLRARMPGAESRGDIKWDNDSILDDYLDLTIAGETMGHMQRNEEGKYYFTLKTREVGSRKTFNVISGLESKNLEELKALWEQALTTH